MSCPPISDPSGATGDYSSPLALLALWRMARSLRSHSRANGKTGACEPHGIWPGNSFPGYRRDIAMG